MQAQTINGDLPEQERASTGIPGLDDMVPA
jgi:hypothetical protein